MTLDHERRRLIETDHRHLWHPFTQMRDWVREEPLIVVEARDCFVKDITGRWFLDGVSSLWVNVHGHRRAELDQAVREQLERVAHTTLLGCASEPAILLAGRLAALLRDSLGDGAPGRVFFSDNGSTAVEVALKMAFQCWQHRGETGRTGFVSLRNGYHGDTLGAVSVGGIDLFHKAFGPLLFKTHQAPSPYCYRCELQVMPADCGMLCLAQMEDILRAHGTEVAAVILEPLMQGAGGMIAAPAGYLKGVRDLCTRYNVLMIADEVATGFGRTGRMFACEHEGVVPDLVCLSKGITGGYLPLAATVATEDIYEAFLGEYAELKTFFHGHSYTGNQLASAAALASLDVFEKDGTLEAMKTKVEILRSWLGEMEAHPHVGEARGVGLMAGVELVLDKETKAPYAWEEKRGIGVARAAREEGVLIRSLGNVVVIMPPLAISEDNLRRMLEVIAGAIDRATGDV